ncbi:hypothetical protein ACM66B_001998 [Microbotryomycetes sp. NB124-2]
MAPPAVADASVLSSAHFPYTPLTPTQRTIGYNQDGQLFVLTRGEINVFTPTLGTQVDSTPASSRALPGSSKTCESAGQQASTSKLNPFDSQHLIPLFRSVLPVEKKEIVLWAEWVNEMQVATPGMVEPFWQSASWSPSGIGSLGGCVLATLTNNCEVLLFEPSKNSHKGEWAETYDLTSHLIRIALPDENFKENRIYSLQERLIVVARVLECQASSLAWSEAVVSAYGDFSILAVGYRSGHIALWRRSGRQKVEILQRYRVDERAGSIVNVAWSRWHTIKTDDDKTLAVACLAVADAQGNVWSLEVSQNVTEIQPSYAVPESPDQVEQAVNQVATLHPRRLCEPDSRAVTQFLYFGDSQKPMLAYAKLGVVNVVTMSSANDEGHDFDIASNDQVELQTEKTWIGSTSYAPCCGLAYFSAQNAIVATLEEGSVHVIGLEGSPHLVQDEDDAHSTAAMSARARDNFERSRPQSKTLRSEQQVKSFKLREGPCVGGFVGLDGRGLVAWHYSISRPDTILYQTNASTPSFLVIWQLAHSEHDVSALRSYVEHVLGGVGQDDASLTRKLLVPLYILDREIENEQVLEYIRSLDNAMDVDGPAATQGVIDAPKLAAAAFGDSLVRDASLDRLRVREALLRFALRHGKLAQEQQHRVLVSHTAVARNVAREVASRLASILSRASGKLQARELAILGRISLASAALPPINPTDEMLLPPDALVSAFLQDESCPACSGAVPLVNIRDASCGNGHKWERCSITFSVISSTNVRTCVSCERKALGQLPSTSSSADDPDGVVNAILRAATSCLYCGGSWMRIR